MDHLAHISWYQEKSSVVPILRDIDRKNKTMTTYHIYLEEKCLFKDLNDEEFKVIWGRIYKSYFKDDLTYVAIEEMEKDVILNESSY